MKQSKTKKLKEDCWKGKKKKKKKEKGIRRLL